MIQRQKVSKQCQKCLCSSSVYVSRDTKVALKLQFTHYEFRRYLMGSLITNVRKHHISERTILMRRFSFFALSMIFIY